MKEQITRREFINSGLSISAGAAFSGSILKNMQGMANLNLSGSGDEMFKGFIVSDAHLGWRGDAQPTLAEQNEMMSRIMKRFPELDLFIDTGDAHHNYAKDPDKGEWTNIIAGGCGRLPFYYVTGNHEICSFSHDWDPEWKANVLGSLECRPYYSWDYKGLHFISLPQMYNMSYLSEEAMDWVKMDMALNKDKTTIVLSHNSIKGTTEYFSDIGYRQTCNSDVIIELFKRYPNVVAWMHGHNHTFEVVPKAGTIYVSNGRIGGFMPKIPKYGEGHLGGIYFEAGKGHFTVRCFSATENKFFDELGGFDHLSHTLKKKTSLDCKAEPNVYYGYGGARDGQKIPVYHHHSAGKKREIYIGGAKNQVINENCDLSVFTQRTNPGWKTKHLAGFNVHPPQEDENKEAQSWEFLDPGIKLRAWDDPEKAKTMFCPGAAWGQRSYYRCRPGMKYKVKIGIDAGKGGQKLQFICRVNDKELERIETLVSKYEDVKAGEQVFEHIFEVPDVKKKRTIYSDEESDNEVQICIGAKFKGLLEPVIVKRYEVSFAEHDGVTLNPAVKAGDVEKGRKGEVNYGEGFKAELPSKHKAARDVYKVKADGNRRLTFIVKETAPRWQVRNAPVADDEGKLTVGPMRNSYSEKNEIVIVPMTKDEDLFVHRLRNIKKAVIEPLEDGMLRIKIKEKMGEPEIEIATEDKPERIEGAEIKSFENGILHLNNISDKEVKVFV